MACVCGEVPRKLEDFLVFCLIILCLSHKAERHKMDDLRSRELSSFLVIAWLVSVGASERNVTGRGK